MYSMYILYIHTYKQTPPQLSATGLIKIIKMMPQLSRLPGRIFAHALWRRIRDSLPSSLQAVNLVAHHGKAGGDLVEFHQRHRCSHQTALSSKCSINTGEWSRSLAETLLYFLAGIFREAPPQLCLWLEQVRITN